MAQPTRPAAGEPQGDKAVEAALLAAVASLRAVRDGRRVDDVTLAGAIEACEAARSLMQNQVSAPTFIDFQALLAMGYRTLGERLSGQRARVTFTRARLTARQACRTAAEIDELGTDELLAAFAIASDEAGQACAALAQHVDADESIDLLTEATQRLAIAASAFNRVGLQREAQQADRRAATVRVSLTRALRGNSEPVEPLTGPRRRAG